MTSQIMALSPVFSYQEDADRFCVIKQGKAQLETVCRMMTAGRFARTRFDWHLRR